ncbi:MAG: hypothetical protein D6690_07585, partial [Nitrospirae bacterium]
MNGWLKNAAALAVGLVFACVVGEGVVRMFLSDEIVLFPRFHTDAHYGDYVLRRLRPNTEFTHRSIDGIWEFHTNNKGFRDFEPYQYEKPKGQIRVLVLGDSHTEGFEVRQDHTFSHLLRKILRLKGLKAQVLNTGVSGFSTAEELVFLEQEGVKYSPDVVVVGFFANDFSDNLKAGLFRLKDGYLVESSRNHIPGVKYLNVINEIGLFRWLSQHSYFYSFVFNGVWNLAKKALLTKA